MIRLEDLKPGMWVFMFGRRYRCLAKGKISHPYLYGATLLRYQPDRFYGFVRDKIVNVALPKRGRKKFILFSEKRLEDMGRDLTATSHLNREWQRE